jgi:D-glycero-alpha-D-manno-heptose-7-phosphate kinase
VAFGGFNRIDFDRKGEFSLQPMALSAERLELFQDHLMLVFTGVSRTASDIAGDKIRAVRDRKKEFTALHEMVDEAMRILGRADSFDDFGRLLHESWQFKRALAEKVSTAHVDAIYERAMKAGAIGGKLLGAGGGGFMLFFAAPDRHAGIREALDGLLHVPFRFETKGSHIIFNEESPLQPSAL